MYSKFKYLVVDDHMLMRNMVAQNLRNLGVGQIETAPNGDGAIEMLSDAADTGTPYNVVFLDWHMPGKSGLDILRFLRSDPRFEKTALVMLTAEQEQKHVLEAIQSGATSYLIKPVSQDALEKNLGKVMDWLKKKAPDLTGKPAPVSEKAADKTDLAQIPEELRNELRPVIAKGVEKIFSELFRVSVVPDNYGTQDCQDMVCIGRLHQDDVTIALRFFFDEALLRPLLSQLYAQEFLQSKDVYEDAACEIVNILCSQVKAFLNKHGYNLELDFPAMSRQDEKCHDAHSFLNIHFTVNDGQFFFVDVRAAGAKK